MFHYRKVGGLHFFRVGRLQLSGCICKAKVRQARPVRPTRLVPVRRSDLAPVRAPVRAMPERYAFPLRIVSADDWNVPSRA